MASKGFTHIEPFDDNSWGWTLSNATISGGVLDITVAGGYGQRSPDANWYSGVSDDFVIEVDWKGDSDADVMPRIWLYLIDDATQILFDVLGLTGDLYRIIYDTVRASAVFNPSAGTWYTARIRRVGTTYYFRADDSLDEISWDMGVEKALNYIWLRMEQCTGEFDNFKYSWIKPTLEGAVSFVGSVSKKQFKTLEGIISFIGTLSISKLYKKLLEGSISFVGDLTKLPKKLLSGSITFVGTLQRKLSLHRLLEGSISFIGTLFGSRLYKKTLEGAISFIGTLSRKRTYRKILEGTISFIGTLGIRKLWSKLARAVASMTKLTRGDASMTKETRDAPSWTKESRD